MEQMQSLAGRDPRRSLLVAAAVALAVAASFIGGVVVGRLPLGPFVGAGVDAPVAPARSAVDAAGRSTAGTDWRRYDPAYGTFRLIAPDALGWSSAATDWSRYDPTYGGFVATPPVEVQPRDAGGRSGPTTAWSQYDPTYGSFAVPPSAVTARSDAAGWTTAGTDWSRYNPQYGSWKR